MFDDPRCYALMVKDYNTECQWALDRYKDKMSWVSGEYILDLGSGTGQTTYEVLRRALRPDFKKLVGTDICPKMVEYAVSHWAKDPRQQFVVMDASTEIEPWSFFDKELQESGGFHKVTSFFCLHWVKDRRQMLRNVYTLLRPGGHALFLFMVENVSFHVWDQIAATEKYGNFFPGIKLPFNDYVYMDDPRKVFISDAENAGFSIVEVEIVERKEAFTGYSSTDEELSARVRSVDPLLRLIPGDVREEYLKDYLKIMKDLEPRGPVDYSGLLVLLKKK